MKVLSTLLTFATLLLATPLCLATPGTLEVTVDSLRIQRDDGLKTHFFKGKYEASLSFKDRKAYLSIIRKDIRTDATVTLPQGVVIPENGAFTIAGTKTGQTFDIEGQVNTTKDQSPTYMDIEYCQWERDEYVCRGRGRHRQCRWETVFYDGRRDIEYHYLTTSRKLNTQLLSDNGGKAQFSGQENDRKKVYTHIGFCR